MRSRTEVHIEPRLSASTSHSGPRCESSINLPCCDSDLSALESDSEFGTVYFVASSEPEGTYDCLDGDRPWHSFYTKSYDQEDSAWDPDVQRKCFVVVRFMVSMIQRLSAVLNILTFLIVGA